MGPPGRAAATTRAGHAQPGSGVHGAVDVAGIVFLVAVVAGWAGDQWDRLHLIDLFALAVPSAVVPAVGRVATRAVPPSAVTATVAVAPLVAVSFLLDPGLAELVVAAYLVVAAASLVASRAGVTFGHLIEPVVELTAVHYGFAGAGATTVAVAAARARTCHRTGHRTTRRTTRIATTSLVLVAASSPFVALGFVTRHPAFQVGAAGTLTVGIVGVAFVTFTDAARRATRPATAWLLRTAAVAPVVPMGLAVAWAAAQHWSLPALDIPAMARTHGLLNAVGFVGCGLLGYRRLIEEEAPPC